MKKFLGLFMASALLLGACGTDEERPVPDTYGQNEVEESRTEEADDGDPDMNDEDDTEMGADSVAEDTESAPDVTEEDTDVDTDSEAEDGDAELDEDIQATLDQDFEEINWTDVHLTKREFDAALYELQSNLNDQYEENEEMAVTIDSIDFSGDTIEVTLNNRDDSEFSDITNNFLAVFIDGFYRQLYLRSDYSDGSTHPRIIIQDSSGDTITDQKDFLEFEE